MSNINSLATEVNQLEIKISELNANIKEMFDYNQVRFMETKGIRTPDIDNNYKKIDSTFAAKSKLEAQVQVMKKEILKIVLDS